MTAKERLEAEKQELLQKGHSQALVDRLVAVSRVRQLCCGRRYESRQVGGRADSAGGARTVNQRRRILRQYARGRPRPHRPRGVIPAAESHRPRVGCRQADRAPI